MTAVLRLRQSPSEHEMLRAGNSSALLFAGVRPVLPLVRMCTVITRPACYYFGQS